MEPNADVREMITSVVTEVELLATSIAQGDAKDLSGTALERALLRFATAILAQSKPQLPA